MWRPEIIVIDARFDTEQRLLKMLLLSEHEPLLLVKILAKLHLHSLVEHWAGEASGRAGVIWQDLCYLRDHWSDHLQGEIDVTEGWLLGWPFQLAVAG